jgi:hypothetical protein
MNNAKLASNVLGSYFSSNLSVVWLKIGKNITQIKPFYVHYMMFERINSTLRTNTKYRDLSI